MAIHLIQSSANPAAGAALGFGVLFGILLIFLIIFVLGILIFVFWLWMLIDCIKREFKNDNDKVIWVLLMVFLGIIASVIYYFVIKREDKKRFTHVGKHK